MAVAVETLPVTSRVARFACEYTLDDAPAEVVERAIRATVDTFAVTVAGRYEPSFTILEATIGRSSGTGEATVLPTRTRISPPLAALLNGTAGHALDFDDVADEISGHPSVVLVPALLAVAEANGNSGREFIEGYVVGFEVACAIARGLPLGTHYRRGWHATATIGILGAVCAVGRLLRLDADQMRHALGIAASMAGGSRQNFGSMTKPLHAGMAARDAVLAAHLAAGGFTADPDQLEGPYGYFSLYGSDARLEAVVEALDGPRVLADHGVNAKMYACCYETHRAADAALALYARGVRAENVESVVMTVQPGGQQAIIHHRPTTGLQGKFSAEYVIAACLLDGNLPLASFSDDCVQRPAIQDLVPRISIRETAQPPFGDSGFDHAYTALDVTLRDGSREQERCDIPRGHARTPLADDELEAKFRDCLAFGESDWPTEKLLSRLRDLPSAARISDVLA